MSLRDALLREGRDIAVEVNQRSLIDKILSRYSGESVVFRELLQNADDASSTEAKIIFQSLEPIDGFPSLKDVRMKSVTVKNNGHVFTDNDWTRLRKIAEGNPDEDSKFCRFVRYLDRSADARYQKSEHLASVSTLYSR